MNRFIALFSLALFLFSFSLPPTELVAGGNSERAKTPPNLDSPADRVLPVRAESIYRIQEIQVPDTLAGWSVTWIANLNGSQSTYSNWSKGGSNNLSVTASSEFSTLYRKESFSYGLRLRTNYGQSRIQNEGVRKTDDRISIRNRFLYQPGETETVRLFGNVNMETQFANGYDYGAGPDGENILISSFLSPAYFTQNAGMAWLPDEELSLEAGVGLKQTLISDAALSERYGLEPGQRLQGEAGFTTGIGYENEIWENVVYTGYVETFTNFTRTLRRTDVIVSNRFTGRINNNLNLTFQFDMIYDDDFSNELQLSQVLSAGLSFVFF